MITSTETGYTFSTKSKKYEVYVCQDGFIELYETENPKNGLFFSNRKFLALFTNALADIVEEEIAKEELKNED